MNAAVSRNLSNVRVASNIGSNVRINSVASPVAAAAPSSKSFLTGWVGIAVVIIVLIALFSIYYNTIGYYIQLGWDKLWKSHAKGERIDIHVPGSIGPSATLTPIHDGGSSGGSSIDAALSGVAQRIESDVEAALGEGKGRKQVFNVSRNIYTYGEAEPLCRAFGAELATYDQVKDAYEAGADWCNYGWIKGQQAVYPTQKSTYEKLQHGPEKERMTCGLPGVNGGYFPNAEQRFGVTCYGERPVETALDERVAMTDSSNIAYDREVNRFRSELDTIAVTPWSGKQWSE